MLKEAARILDEATRTRQIPAAVLRVDVAGQTVHESAHGVTGFYNPQAITIDTWFDLASLTKILATAPATMLLAQHRAMSLDEPLGACLPEMKSPLAEVRLRRFLSHASGAAAWRPYYLRVDANKLRTPEAKHEIRKMHLAETPEYPPGSRELYSDVGFALLGFAVEAVTGESLDRFVIEHIVRQVAGREMDYLQINPRAGIQIAATEACPWRGRVLAGEVHDENTWAAGGCLGQAGLFGTASAVAALMEEYRLASKDRGRLYNAETIRMFMRKNTGSPDATRRLGFDSPSRADSSAGRYFGPNSFGHLGFTGVSAWCDPDKQLTVVLLTNRVHPTRENQAHRHLRPSIHDAVVTELKL
jgi:CubicO group peptidase (beta-lactamase class C family)